MNGAEMIPCDQVIVRLWEYIDGELTEETAAAVRDHLDLCAHCFPQYDFQHAYKEFVRRTATQAVPPSVKRRIFEALLEEHGPNGGEVRTGLTARLLDAFRSLFGRGRE